MNDTYSALELLALSAAGVAIQLLRPIGGPMKPVADQGIRSATSAALQIVEGLARTGRDKTSKLRGGYAEAREIGAILLLLASSGDIAEEAARKPITDFDSVRAQVWRILHPRR